MANLRPTVAGIVAVLGLALGAQAADAAVKYPVPRGSALLSSYGFEDQPSSSQQIFQSDGWTVYQSTPDRVSSGSDGLTAPQGDRWGRFEVVPGEPLVANGPRAQISSNPPIRNEWVTQSCGRWYIPSYSDLPGPYGSWQILYEEHPTGPSSNPLYANPPEALWIRGTRGQAYDLRLASGTGMRLDWETTDQRFLPNTWHSYCVRALWSSDAHGWVQLWVDGQWQTLNNGQRRKHQVTMPSQTHYTMVGIYNGAGSANRQHSVTYMDDIQIWKLRRAHPGSAKAHRPRCGDRSRREDRAACD